MISTYGPNGYTKYPAYLESLREVLDDALTGDCIVLLGDFNAHVCNDSEWCSVFGLLC